MRKLLTLRLFFKLIELVVQNLIADIFKKNISIKYCIILVFFFSSSIINGQEQKSILKVYLNPIDSDYWWLQKNNNGKYIVDKEIEYEWEFKTLKTEYKISFSNAYKKNQKLDFGESFIKHNFSDQTFLRAGNYYRDFSRYLNDNLSSGSMLVSNNAQAMPKIGLVTSQNIRRNQNVTFDMGISHGFFNKTSYYIKAPVLHEKFIYIKIKKDNHEFGIGAVHEAMWGGNIIYAEGSIPERNFPVTLKNFFKVFIAEDGDYEGGPHANALGNHLGIWDFYYQKNNDNQVLKLYYQHFFEDTSSLRFQNKIDGLWGIELKNYIPNMTLLFEYLDTTNCCINPPYQDDDYYGNYQYVGGWRYKDNIIGNSFVNNLEPSNIWIRNTDLTKLFHIGINGQISSNYYELKASRKININDTIRYKIKIGKIIKDKFDFNVFMVNNNTTSSLGVSMSYLLKISKK